MAPLEGGEGMEGVEGENVRYGVEKVKRRGFQALICFSSKKA